MYRNALVAHNEAVVTLATTEGLQRVSTVHSSFKYHSTGSVCDLYNGMLIGLTGLLLLRDISRQSKIS